MPNNQEEAIALMESIQEALQAILEYLQAEPEPPPDPDPLPPTAEGIWLSQTEIMALPMEGPAWENVLAAAQKDTTRPNLGNQDDQTDVHVLAKALVWARTGEVRYRDEVVQALWDVMGTEVGENVGPLPIARGLLPYVIAADLIKLKDSDPTLDNFFRQWLSEIRHVVFTGAGPKLSLIQCHEKRPNNFGTHAGASRIAIALYLNDTADLQAAANVFRGWLGDRNAYSDFSYGDLEWQSDPNNPVGINPAGATLVINGAPRNVDGVLPDDQRRDSGPPVWPFTEATKENYVWEALQGAVVQAELLTRAGYPAWEWEEQALLRAVVWLYEQADYPPEGDDRWIPWIINKAYGMNFPGEFSTPGKGMGWADWTHAPK